MWKRLIRPLQSRKVRVAMVTVIAAFAAEYGLNVPTELLMTILAVGVSIILGIAHEDNGLKQALGAGVVTHTDSFRYADKAVAERKPK